MPATHGPCAKRQVICTLVSPGGEIVGVGTNDCATPQASCPREPGDSYEKCRSICDQPHHAEIGALRVAGRWARGATAWIEGIDAICGDCLRAMAEAGIARVEIRPDISLEAPQ